MVEVARDTCKLQTADDEIIEADLEDARMSVIINGMIEDDWDMEEPLPIAQVNKAVMQKILVFC